MQPLIPSERRGSLSSFESLLRLDDAKAPDGQHQPGIGTAVLYLRVSTQRQMLTAIDIDPDGNSIATQRESTIKRAKRLQSPIIKEFVEPGHSAQSIAKRPVFRELLHYVEDNPEVSYVIIYMRSRVFRNQTDAAITKRILDSMGVKLISAKEEFGEGYMADAMEAITDIMNEVQVRQSGEDISSKMYHKAKNGGTNGRARIGYLNIRKDVEGHLVNSIAIDPQRAPLVTWAFEQYATGEYSLTRLRQELEDQGLTTRRTAKWEEKGISRSQLGLMLRDPYYLGMVPYKGEVFPGKHDALVTPEVFEQVEQVLDVRKQRTQRDTIHNHLLRGMLNCGRCHAEGRHYQLVYSRVSNSYGGTYEYYLCIGRQHGKCDLPHLPVALVENALLREVQSLQLTSGEIVVMREQVKERLEQRLSSERGAHARVKKELAAVDVKEERLLDLAADGSLSTDKVRERLAKLQVQRNALTQRLSATEDIIRQESDMVLNYLDLLEKPGAFYATADDNVKRKLLTAYFSQIRIDDDGHGVIPQTQSQAMVVQIQEAAHRSVNSAKSTELLLGASENPDKTLHFKDVCLNNADLVHRVDRRSNKSALLPPTLVELARLVKIARKSQPEATLAANQEYIARNLRRRLGPRVIAELVKRYREGEHTTDLSKEISISRTGLHQLFLEEGVSFRRQPMAQRDIGRAVQLYESGMTIKEVVQQVGYSCNTVRNVLLREGVSVRAASRRKRTA